MDRSNNRSILCLVALQALRRRLGLNLHDKLGDHLFNLDEVVGAVGEEQLELTAREKQQQQQQQQQKNNNKKKTEDEAQKKAVADIAGFDKKLSAREKARSGRGKCIYIYKA